MLTVVRRRVLAGIHWLLKIQRARNQSSPSKLIACLIRNVVGGKGGGKEIMLTVVRFFRVLAKEFH